MTVAEAAQEAGVSTRYVRRCCREGVVYATQAAPGSAWRVDRGSWAAWLRGRRMERERKAA